MLVNMLFYVHLQCTFQHAFWIYHRYLMILGPGPASADPLLIGRECFLFLAEQLISWQLVAAGGSWCWVGAAGSTSSSALIDDFLEEPWSDPRSSVHRDVHGWYTSIGWIKYCRIVEEDEEFGNSNLDISGFFGFWSMMIPDPRLDDLIHPKWSPGWVMLYDVVASGLRYQHSVNSSCLPSAFSGLEKVSQVDNLCQCMFSTHVVSHRLHTDLDFRAAGAQSFLRSLLPGNRSPQAWALSRIWVPCIIFEIHMLSSCLPSSQMLRNVKRPKNELVWRLDVFNVLNVLNVCYCHQFAGPILSTPCPHRWKLGSLVLALAQGPHRTHIWTVPAPQASCKICKMT